MRTLPRRANLEQLRKQAKELLRAQRNADLTACDPLRCMRDRLGNVS